MNNIKLEVDTEYCFDLESETHPDYRVTKHIMEWLKHNMENLTDNKNRTVFSKVNYGYNQDTLKGFGKKPVCDVYINKLTYTSDLKNNIPDSINTFIICYLKGTMNNTYLKACELTDYLLQGFEENLDWRELILTDTVNNETIETRIIRDTFVRNVDLQIIPGNKTYGVLCAFELEHKLY